ncbi:MAG: hypothetical protein ACI9D8_000390, partial [Reinekea sp.]
CRTIGLVRSANTFLKSKENAEVDTLAARPKVLRT